MKQIFLVTLLFALFFNTKTVAQVGSGLDTLTLVNGYRLVEYAPGVTFAKTWFTNVDPYHGRFSQFFEVGRNTPNVANIFTYYAVFKKKLKNRIKVEGQLSMYMMKYASSTPVVGSYSEIALLGVALGKGDSIDSYSFSKKNISRVHIWDYAGNFQSLFDSIDCVYIKISGSFKNTVIQIDYLTFVHYITGPAISVIENFEDSTITNIIENESNIPTNFSLSQNYPNPFNPKTTIRFQLSKSDFVTLKVFDVLGREVAILVNEERPVGEHSIPFNGLNLPSGMYFYNLNIGHGQFVQTKKMILMK